MNKTLEQFTRDQIKSGLSQLPEGHQKLFKRMYSFENMAKGINDIVDGMDETKLDWALTQVKKSLEKILENK